MPNNELSRSSGMRCPVCCAKAGDQHAEGCPEGEIAANLALRDAIARALGRVIVASADGIDWSDRGHVERLANAAVRTVHLHGSYLSPARAADSLQRDTLPADHFHIPQGAPTSIPEQATKQDGNTSAAKAGGLSHTDLSKRLREWGTTRAVAQHYADAMVAAADEIDRYYTGMLAWKQTAEKKDADWSTERMGRVNDRIAARTTAADAGGLSKTECGDTACAGCITNEGPCKFETRCSDCPYGKPWDPEEAPEDNDRPAAVGAGDQDAEKAVHWFSCLDKCARLLELPDDEPIPSGVVAAVERLVRAAKLMLDEIEQRPTAG